MIKLKKNIFMEKISLVHKCDICQTIKKKKEEKKKKKELTIQSQQHTFVSLPNFGDICFYKHPHDVAIMSPHLRTEKSFTPSLITTVSGSNVPGKGAQHGGGTKSGRSWFTML